MFGVTRQAISWHKRQYGGQLTSRERVLQHWPFIVPEALSQSSLNRRLRDHGEYVATNGVDMTVDELQRLGAFYATLRNENLVVEFDPAIPPEPGVSTRGGWALRPREAVDADLLIRVNEHTHLTAEGRDIWRFPSILLDAESSGTANPDGPV